MDIRLQPLRYFIALAEERSFTRAASRVGISQPSLSEAIRELEASLQISLFTRSSRFVELSPDGAELLGAAREAVDSVDRFRARALDLNGKAQNKPLRIGAPLYSASPSLELELIEDFSKKHSSIDPIVVRRTVVDLISGLKNNSLDIAFLLGAISDSDLSILQISFIQFHLVVPAISPYAGHEAVPLKSLAGLHVASYERAGSPAIFDRLMAPLAAAGLVMDIVLESSIFGMSRHSHMHGSGMLVPQEWLPAILADGAFVCRPISDLTLGLELVLARTVGPRSRPVQLFWDFVAEAVAQRDTFLATNP